MLVSPSPLPDSFARVHKPISARSSRERKVNAPETIPTALRCQEPRTRAAHLATYRPAQYHPSPPDNPRRTRVRVLTSTILIIEQRRRAFIALIFIRVWPLCIGITDSEMES